MLLADERAAIVACCRSLRAAGLVVGTAGNVSVRSGELVALTPSGVDYDELTPDLVGVHRLSGEPVEAPLPATSEAPMHLACYASTAAGAVVHTHSPAATALSCVVDEIPPVHYYLGLFGGRVRVAPYAGYGTEELAAGVLAALGDGSACLMGNHGAMTVGPDLATAHERARYLEHLCDITLRVQSSGRTPRLLSAAEMSQATGRMSRYGRR